MDTHYPIEIGTFLILQGEKRWITVMRKGEKLDTVRRYVNNWPVWQVGEGAFIVCIPYDQEWFADRLASGLFYAKLHPTYGDALNDIHANLDLLTR